MSKLFALIRDSTVIHFAMLMAFALVLNREGTRVPGGNEQVYLLYLVKAWHAGFLASDWTFQEPTAGHPVFNFVFGWPTLFMSIEAVGWVGRLGSWGAIFAALMRIGRHLRIPCWMVTTGILLWLIQRQSFVSNEWIIGTFEAKCAAYACLLWAIDFILRGRVVVPAILTGLAFTFHSAVGLWGGAAVALAFVSLNPIKVTAKFTAWAALAALPGVITSLKLVFGGHAISADEARYLVISEMPFHLDPLTFGPAKIAVLYMMLLFNWMQARGEMLNAECGMLNEEGTGVAVGSALRTISAATEVTAPNKYTTGIVASCSLHRYSGGGLGGLGRGICFAPAKLRPPPQPSPGVPREGEKPDRSFGGSQPSTSGFEIGNSEVNIRRLFLIRFQLASGVFFLAGIVFRVLGKFSLVELFPFRVFAVTVMLFFFWHLAAAYRRRRERKCGPALIALGILTFLCLPSPVARLQGLAADQLPKWRRGDDDFRAAAKWVRDNAPPEAVVIAPPWRKDASYFTHRPLVADWHAPRYDAMTEWRQRIEALVGDVSHMSVDDNLAGEMDTNARSHYASLSPAELSAIRHRYGGDLLITEGRYDYTAVFRSGRYTVYQLGPAKDGRTPSTASVGP